ncbi:signal peptidase II [Agrobacterium genomosp. 3]|nr:signal peptidase II [Agrobacterium tomkonis]MCA1879724.1 signal peptidase II [Agrobacterium tumefaciens]MCA1894983.1 signal peptidase II [Agrobacterium tomkonis]
MVVAVGVTLDLATKAWARATLEPYGPALDFLPFVSLRLTFNEGISFSLFAFEGDMGQMALLAVTGLMTLIMAVWAYRSQGWQRAALSLVVAGALANLIDRSLRGSVTDFLGLHFGNWYPFVFNLADVWISVGVLLLLAAPWLTQMQNRPATSRI